MKRNCCYKKENLQSYNCECTYGCNDCTVHFICRACYTKYQEIPSKVKDQRWEKQRSEKIRQDFIAGILRMDPMFIRNANKATQLQSKTRKELEAIARQLRS